MQWDSSNNAGFTEGTPWLKVNKNYKEVNVESDITSRDSVFEYYKNIIKFRKENYDLIDCEIDIKADGDILIFKKGKLSFVANFSKYVLEYKKLGTPLFTNYETQNIHVLRPYEVFVTLK